MLLPLRKLGNFGKEWGSSGCGVWETFLPVRTIRVFRRESAPDEQ